MDKYGGDTGKQSRRCFLTDYTSIIHTCGERGAWTEAEESWNGRQERVGVAFELHTDLEEM